jgi:hypothetical protein
MAHQSLHALAVDAMPLRSQRRRHPTRAEEWPGSEQLVESLHHHQVVDRAAA